MTTANEQHEIDAIQRARTQWETEHGPLKTWAQQTAQTDNTTDPHTTNAFDQLLDHYPPPDPNGTQPTAGPLTPHTTNWATFWNTDHTETDWFAEPVLANGRGHVLYAPAKTGKSLLALELAAAIATGRPILDTPTQAPRRVLYIDYEMTPSDLQQRLIAFGYGPADDLTHLRYVQLPPIPPLDTDEGGRWITQDAHLEMIDLVVIDTTIRAVQGEENAAETIRDLYRHTLMHLKQAGITTLRVDHSGKDTTRGQRGSSAKNDDADIVWLLTRDAPTGDMHTLTATHRRVSWVPEKIFIRRTEDARPMHQRVYDIPTDELEFDPQIRAAADALDAVYAPGELSRKRLREWLDQEGHPITFANETWADIRRLRQQRDLKRSTNPNPEDLY